MNAKRASMLLPALSWLAILAVAVTTGCASGPGLKPDPGEAMGFVVATIGQRLTGANAGKASFVELVFRNASTGHWGAIQFDERPLTSTAIAYEDINVKLGVVAIPVRPGTYELEAVSFQYPGGTIYRSRTKISLPFSVSAGESAYLGEFLGHSTPSEGPFGTNYSGGFLTRRNSAPRDVPLIRKAHPETAATVFRETGTADVRPPYIVRFRASRATMN